jgi:hypothetical protein
MRGRFARFARFATCSALAIAPFAINAGVASAATHTVGPGGVADLNSLTNVQPGDVIEMQGGQTYPPAVLKFQGTKEQKITIRGVRVNGQRPIISGGETTLQVESSHVVLEGLDITGGSRRCVFHHANDVTIRDSVIHHCSNDGIIGADNDSGSLTLESSEIHHNGNGERFHQIYMSTDENAYPGSVFRMQNCYMHDGNGGNGIKSRAERNEIYSNWIEGGYYHDIELIGPDPSGDVDEGKAREDSDVVGNVFRKSGQHTSHYVARVGGDGTGQTAGRFRFVNNTFLLAGDSPEVFRLYDAVDSLELHNNVFFRMGGGPLKVLRTAEVGSPEPLIAGSDNWFPTASEVPADWTGSRFGADPGFVNLAGNDLRPAAGSPLIDQGQATPATLAAKPFPTPLATQALLPPVASIGPSLTRAVVGAIDLGAFEFGDAPVTTTAASAMTVAPSGGGTAAPAATTPAPVTAPEPVATAPLATTPSPTTATEPAATTTTDSVALAPTSTAPTTTSAPAATSLPAPAMTEPGPGVVTAGAFEPHATAAGCSVGGGASTSVSTLALLLGALGALGVRRAVARRRAQPASIRLG